MSVYDLLYAMADPMLRGYRADLEKHDKEALEANPGVPFLHWTRRNGTHITFLPDADTYPAVGVSVPYLFGSADRRHVLKEKACNARHFLNPCYEDSTRGAIVVHFDGRKLRRITAQRALEIVQEYQRRIDNEWRVYVGGVNVLGTAHCYC